MPAQAGSRQEAAFTRHQRKDGTLMDVELVSHELELDGRRARLVLATDISDRARTRAALHQSEEQLRQVAAARRGGPPGRRRGPRLQQHPHHDPRLRRHAPPPAGRGRSPAGRRRPDPEGGRPRACCSPASCWPSASAEAPKPQLLDLHQAIRSMEGLIRRLLGADIQLELRLLLRDRGAAHGSGAPRPAAGQPRPQRPRRDAAGRHAHDRDRRAPDRRRRAGPPGPPGPYILLAIRDTGTGMDGEARAHLLRAVPPTDPRRAAGRPGPVDRATASCGRTAESCGCPASRGRAPR